MGYDELPLLAKKCSMDNRKRLAPKGRAFSKLSLLFILSIATCFFFFHSAFHRGVSIIKTLIFGGGEGGTEYVFVERKILDYERLCAFRKPHEPPAPPSKRINQRRKQSGASCTLIQNATFYEEDGGFRNGDILLKDGLVYESSKKYAPVSFCDDASTIPMTIVNAMGRIVTAGLVDMHSHAGLNPWPSLQGSDDVNEIHYPTMPFLRTLDAFDNKDEALKLILAGGVTSMLVIPGSANLIGGEVCCPLKLKNKY